MSSELHVKTASGNKKALTMHIKTAGGNKQVAEAWIKTAGGNKKFWPTAPAITDLSILYAPYVKTTQATLLGNCVRQALVVGFNVVGGSGTYNVNYALSAIDGFRFDTFGNQEAIAFAGTDVAESYMSINTYASVVHSLSSFNIAATQFTTTLHCDTDYQVFPWNAGGDQTAVHANATITFTVEDAVSLQTISEAVAVKFIWFGQYQYCIDSESYMPFDFRADEVYDGMPLYVLDEETMSSYKEHHVVNHTVKEEIDSVEIETSSGIQLIVSKATPLTIQSGKVINVMNSLGEYVPVLDNDEFRWEEIVKLTDVGPRKVVRIYADNSTYAAGKQPNRFIFTHNKIEP